MEKPKYITAIVSKEVLTKRSEGKLPLREPLVVAMSAMEIVSHILWGKSFKTSGWTAPHLK
jgi:hypothetical protein